MKRNGKDSPRTTVRCAIYTRKSTEEGLDQEFNSLDAQREAAEAYIASQKAEGWACVPDRFDDGGFTGGNMARPALKRLMIDIEAGQVDCVVVYKVDRLSRSLMDFARMMQTFEDHGVSFVSVTQQFNTTHSMGRLTLNILLSFAQFEREIISERTRDKIAASRRKGKWSGGHPPLGYDLVKSPGGSKLAVNQEEAERVRTIFEMYLERQSLIGVVRELNRRRWSTKAWVTGKGVQRGGHPFDKSRLLSLLKNPVYMGRIRYKDATYPGEHEAIVDEAVWQRTQRTLKSNGRSGGTHVRNRHGALLKEILHCKPCGTPMVHSFTARGNRRYRYYVCYTAQKRGWDACTSKSVPAEEIERFVVDRIRAIGQDPKVLSMALEQARARQMAQVDELGAEVTCIDRQTKELDRRIRKAAKTAANDGNAASTLADLHRRRDELVRQRAEVTERIETAQGELVTKAEVDAALAAFDPLWESLAPREHARVLRLLIRSVEYDGAAGKVAVTFHANGLNGFATAAGSNEPPRSQGRRGDRRAS